MSIKHFFRRLFRDNAVTSETLEAEALAMLKARPGDVVPVKNIDAHIRAGTFSKVAALKAENARVLAGTAVTSPIYPAACTSVVYWPFSDDGWRSAEYFDE